jgi:hypothetical protein
MADAFLRSLQQALQSNSKSTVLKSLGWLIAMLLSATVWSGRSDTNQWLVVMLAIFSGIAIATYIGFYIYFALKDPELLRSEKYTIQKMAIQHGFIGDDASGFFKVTQIVNTPLLTDSKKEDLSKQIK